MAYTKFRTLWFQFFTLMLLLTSFYLKAETNNDIIRSAFIYQMSKFVHWNVSEDQTINFCFIESTSSHIGSVLENKGKLTTQGKVINIYVIKKEEINKISSYQDCSLIYFDEKASNTVNRGLLATISEHKITIGATKSFLENGGLTALVPEKNKLRLYINRIAYNKGLLKIQSRLLSLARFYPN